MIQPSPHDVPDFAVVGRVDTGKSAVIAILWEIEADHRARQAARKQAAQAAK